MINACVLSDTHGRPKWRFTKNGTPIYECTACGCFMAETGFDNQQYEGSGYYTVALPRREVEDEWGFRWRYLLRKAINLMGKPNVLDVGAGNGYFVYLARHEFGLDAHGTEISTNEARYAKELFGLELRNVDLSEIEGRFDLVTCFNVLEHVPDPASLLAATRAKLREGGVLFLTTPNPSCIHRRLRGLRRWNMIDPPHHLNIFTKSACEQLLRRIGFEPLGYDTLSTYIRFVRRFDGDGQHLRRSIFALLKATNLGADHFFWARRATACARG